MKMNLYYPPYPVQIFEGESLPVNPARPLTPKSTLPTLASGIRFYAAQMGFNIDFEIIDLQLGGELTFYKQFMYGPRKMNCFQLGTPYEKINSKILTADIHGITSNHTNAAQTVADLVKHIKMLAPDSLVIVGGTDATARPYYYIKNGADVVVKGEGEYVNSLVIQSYINNGKKFDNIPNICTKNNMFDLNIDYSHLVDINQMPVMSLDLIEDISIYTDTAEGPVPEGVNPNFICWETSRGCAWSCSFCTSASRGTYRTLTPDTVKRHFEYFKKNGVKNIVWQEDNPLSRIQKNGKGEYIRKNGRKELLEIFKLAREYGFSWEFANGIEFCKFATEDGIDYELLDHLLWNDRSGNDWKGCYRVQIPLDNLALEIKPRFPKLLTFERQLDVLKAMLTYSGMIHQTYDLFIGYPEQDSEVIDRFTNACLTIKDTLSSIDNNYVPYFNVFNLALLPGSHDYHRYCRKLAFDIDENPEVIGIFMSAMDTEYYSYYELYQKRLEMSKILNDDDFIKRYDGTYTI